MADMRQRIAMFEGYRGPPGCVPCMARYGADTSKAGLTPSAHSTAPPPTWVKPVLFGGLALAAFLLLVK